MKKLFPFVVFILVAVASLGMASYAYVAGQDAARFKFEAAADEALNRVQSRIDLHISMLRAARGMFAARSGRVSRAEFRSFFEALQVEENFEGMRGIGYLGLGQAGDLPALESQIRELHGEPKRIYPDTDQEMRAPILLFEPLDGSRQSVIGYDMFTDPARRDAIQAAVYTGRPRASEHILLGQNTVGDVFPGFLVFYSVDAPAEAAGTYSAANYSAADHGVLFAAFRTADLFNAALDKFPVLPIHVEVFGAEADPNEILFWSSKPAADEFGDDFLIQRQIVVAGQPWTLQLRPTADFAPPSSGGIPIVLGAFGLMLAGALALAARYQIRAFDAVSELHEATEKSLGEKDLMLQEMKHRIKNSITRVLAIARQTASGSSDIEEFSASFGARLQAMAASQDMLTRSRWQKADLAELLRIELGQVFGKEFPDDMLSGPKVLLSETETQALGLTFHELATNALKYGEAGNSAEALKVTWSLPRDGRETSLALRWTETGQGPIDPPTQTGFGTKLIEMNIRHELGGSIRRVYGADGLVIEIEIPLSAARRQARQ